MLLCGFVTTKFSFFETEYRRVVVLRVLRAFFAECLTGVLLITSTVLTFFVLFYFSCTDETLFSLSHAFTRNWIFACLLRPLEYFHRFCQKCKIKLMSWWFDYIYEIVAGKKTRGVHDSFHHSVWVVLRRTKELVCPRGFDDLWSCLLVETEKNNPRLRSCPRLEASLCSGNWMGRHLSRSLKQTQ
jgi:hypothetical protein